jgi:hypothetical protein
MFQYADCADAGAWRDAAAGASAGAGPSGASTGRSEHAATGAARIPRRLGVDGRQYRLAEPEYLPVAKQQTEALAILDRAKALNLNAIVLQVRPSADAIYPSQLEPWSEFLTGQQGRAPAQPWDPLQFWIEQAHARGLELHAWFNPYRARHATAKSPLAANHIGRTQPDVVKSYGRYLWMDPGEAAASQHTLDVVLDVVRRYDIDGVHIDDYFYPYPIDTPNAAGPEGVALDGGVGAKQELEFPDQPSWQRYLLGGGTLDRANWRRQNVNSLIEAMYPASARRSRGCASASAHSASAARTGARPASPVSASTTSCMRMRNCGWPTAGSITWRRSCTGRCRKRRRRSMCCSITGWRRTRARATCGRACTPAASTTAPRPSRRKKSSSRSASRAAAAACAATCTSHRRADGEPQGHRRSTESASLPKAALTPATPWLGNDAPAAPQAAARRESNGVALKLSAGAGKPVAQYAIWSRYGASGASRWPRLRVRCCCWPTMRRAARRKRWWSARSTASVMKVNVSTSIYGADDE